MSDDKSKDLLDHFHEEWAPTLHWHCHKAAKNRPHLNLEPESLYNTARIGLHKALRSYDSSKGSFKTHLDSSLPDYLLSRMDKPGEVHTDDSSADPYFYRQAQMDARKQKVKSQELGSSEPPPIPQEAKPPMVPSGLPKTNK